MLNINLHPAKMAFIAASFFFAASMHAQTTVSSEKDITRPEVNRSFADPAVIISFAAVRNNGFNEVQWMARGEQDTRKFIVEYSDNGTYYQTAGEMIASKGTYHFNHTTQAVVPLLYRIKTELLNGKYYYSQAFMLEGVDVAPVKVYPTIVTGNTFNIRAYFPVQRLAVLSNTGQQVYTKDINGNAEDMSIVVPTLSRGIYLVHFTGQGWQSTERIIVQ